MGDLFTGFKLEAKTVVRRQATNHMAHHVLNISVISAVPAHFRPHMLNSTLFRLLLFQQTERVSCFLVYLRCKLFGKPVTSKKITKENIRVVGLRTCNGLNFI